MRDPVQETPARRLDEGMGEAAIDSVVTLQWDARAGVRVRETRRG